MSEKKRKRKPLLGWTRDPRQDEMYPFPADTSTAVEERPPLTGPRKVSWGQLKDMFAAPPSKPGADDEKDKRKRPSFSQMMKPGLDALGFNPPGGHGPQNFMELASMFTPPPATPPPQHGDPSQMLAWALSQPGIQPVGATVYHGTPHTFAPVPENPLGAFDMSKIGTGEGAAAYGHGTYLAEDPAVAHYYRNNLVGGYGKPKWLYEGKEPQAFYTRSALDHLDRKEGESIAAALARNIGELRKHAEFARKVYGEVTGKTYSDAADILQSLDPTKVSQPGAVYRVELPDEHLPRLLDWDARLSEQPELIPRLDEASRNPMFTGDFSRGLQQAVHDPRITGEQFMRLFGQEQQLAPQSLGPAGVPGLKYLDQGSRAAGAGTRNYVVWQPEILRILGIEP